MSRRLKYIIAQKLSPTVNGYILPYKFHKLISSNCVSPEHPSLSLEIGKSVNNLNEFKHLKNVDTVFHTSGLDSNSIHITFDRNYYVKTVLEEIIKKETTIGHNKEIIVIDYSSPNIAKPFHVGHLRSTIIGNYIAKINEYFTNNVTKLNYLGDWGTQFGLLKVGMESTKLNTKDLNENPIHKLYECYVAANQLAKNDSEISEKARLYFSSIEKGETDLGEWKMIKQFTVTELQRIYQRLNVKFDVYNWESDYNVKAIEPVIEMLKHHNCIHRDSEGKWVAHIDGRDVAVLKSDNSSLYLTRDIAALIDRYEKYKFNKMLYVVDNSQADHFKALFSILKTLNKSYSDFCQHVKFGRVKGMSTRQGTVVFLNDILDEAKGRVEQLQLKSPNTRASATNEEVCDTLGTTAVIVNDLKRSRLKDYKFEWDRALQTDGDSGIRLQYIHCRLWSLEQKCGHTLPDECDPTLLQEFEVIDLVVELAKFDDILEKAKNDMEACILTGYLFKLAHKINRAFQKLNIKNAEKDVARQRLLLFHAARLVIRDGLMILGVKPLNEM